MTTVQMDTLKSLLSISKSIAAAIPFKGWVFLFGFVVGIPMSIYSAQWMGFKLVKQETDCYTNIAYDMENSKAVTHEDRLVEIKKIHGAYSTCLGKVDPIKGSVEFLKEQYERQKAGRL